MRELFFFYGSLRSGYWNQRILTPDAQLVGPARTMSGFDLFIGKDGHVPTCTPREDAPPLHGELWSLNERDAAAVRRLEAGYEEGIFDVTLEADEDTIDVHQAHIYHHTDPASCWYLSGGPVLVPSGDYTSAIGPGGQDMR